MRRFSSILQLLTLIVVLNRVQSTVLPSCGLSRTQIADPNKINMHRFSSILLLLTLVVVLNRVQSTALPSRGLSIGFQGLDRNLQVVADEVLNGNETEVDDHTDLQHEDDHDDHSGGDTVEQASSTSEFVGEDHSKPWGDVIVATLVINLATLTGVAFLSGEFVAKYFFKNDIFRASFYKEFTNNIIPSFACGALLATTIFLVLPEALYLITAHFTSTSSESHAETEDAHDHRFLQEEKDADGQAVWRFGTCFICGFLLPILTSALFPHSHSADAETLEGDHVDSSETDRLKKVDDESEVPEEPSAPKPSAGDTAKSPASVSQTESDVVVNNGTEKLPLAIDWPLAVSIMAGDLFHNFADGIFVGTAFLNCNRDLAIAISAATVYHEIAQEIADYFLLTKLCNIPPLKALLLNFIDGLPVLFGAIMIVGIEDMSDVGIGSILAVSSGVYFYVSVAECVPRARAAHKTLRDKLISLMAFVTGVVPIGLVLINHEHCDPGHDHSI